MKLKHDRRPERFLLFTFGPHYLLHHGGVGELHLLDPCRTQAFSSASSQRGPVSFNSRYTATASRRLCFAGRFAEHRET